MGFFGDLLKVALPIAGSVFGGAAAGTAISALIDPATPAVVTTGLSPAAQARVAAGTVVAPVSLTTAQAIAARAGRMRKRTIIQTFDPVTGVVSRQESFAGGVAVRSADVAAFRRVFRQITSINKKLPRKLIKQGQVKQLTDRLVRNALEQAGDLDGACPK